MNRPCVTPHQPPCAAEGRMQGDERRSLRGRALQKMAIATPPRRLSRQPSCRPRAMRAGSARLHGQSWRGSNVPTSAWPNSHRRAGDRLERPTLCPAPSTRRSPLSLVGLTAAGHAELLATRLSRAATTAPVNLDVAQAQLLISCAGDALCDPWCIRSGSLTGSPGGCQCLRRGSNFETSELQKPAYERGDYDRAVS